MNEANWISNASVNWEDPTLCSEEWVWRHYIRSLRTLVVETCILLEEEEREPLLVLLDLIDLESWTYRDVLALRLLMIRITPVVNQLVVVSRRVDLVRWGALNEFAESWSMKVRRGESWWYEGNSFRLN